MQGEKTESGDKIQVGLHFCQTDVVAGDGVVDGVFDHDHVRIIGGKPSFDVGDAAAGVGAGDGAVREDRVPQVFREQRAVNLAGP